ncbi:phage tail tube protein [Oerskovia sp. NPDC060338]|uniref:phage tail tube protein n=1 Tax=Oerskovia sp. NPDC060338 TaxID=3347100 RepID=UPI00365D9538
MTTSPSVPAGTTLGKSYEYGMRIDLGYPGGAENFVDVRRMSELQPTPTPVTQDVQTYDDFGAPNSDKTSESFGITLTVLGNRSSVTGKYLPELQKFHDATRPSAKGEDAVVRVQYFHKPETGTPDPDDAFEGLATVSIGRQNAGADGAVERSNITLTGKGQRKEIANPFAGWGVTTPQVTGVSPAAAAAGELVTITGSGFLGATAVKFGAVSAGDFEVIGGSTIVAIVPAGAAGPAAVTVTTPGGVSLAFAYTRGA